MMSHNKNKMIIALTFLCFPALALCGICHVYFQTLECTDIAQDEFMYKIFNLTYADSNEGHIYNVIISNSDYATIEEFPNLENIQNEIDSLTIRNSSINTIADDAFRWFRRLRTLDLSQNKLKNLSFVETLPYKLKYLILNNNAFIQLNLNYFPYTSLSFVDLSNNKISKILPSFILVELDYLDISYNKLTEFNETSVRLNCKSLNLSYNNLENIEIKGQKHLLKILGNNISSINSNKPLTVSKLYLNFIPKNQLNECSLLSLANSSIVTLNDENKIKFKEANEKVNVDLSNSSVLKISNNTFQNMDSKKLTLKSNNFKTSVLSGQIDELDLSYSKIYNLTREVFSNVAPHLVALNLRGNSLTDFGFLSEILPNLINLDLSNNKFKQFDLNTFENCSSLISLNISNTLLSSVQLSSTSVNVLDLSKNFITYIGPDDFERLKNLKTLILDNNKISFIDNKAFKGLKDLNILSLSNNNIKVLNNTLFSNLYVKYLYLQGNNINIIKSNTFDRMPNVEIINLSNIGLKILEDIAFYNLPKLESLVLSNNNLTVLDKDTFSNLVVQYLDLSGNKLEKIRSEAFKRLHKLKHLDLSNLGIQSLEPFAFSTMFVSFIDLRNNKLSGILPNVFKNVYVDEMFLNGISESVYLYDNSVTIRHIHLQFNGILKRKAISNLYLKYLNIVDSQIDLMKNDCLLGNYNLKKIYFINSSVLTIEPYIFRGLFSLTNLDASDVFKNVKILGANVFQDLKSLKVLKISGTQLLEIQEGAFFGLSNLKELYLNGNMFKSIKVSTFGLFNSTLQILDLSQNLFTSLNVGALCYYLPKLQTLNVSSNVGIQLLDANVNVIPNLKIIFNE